MDLAIVNLSKFFPPNALISLYVYMLCTVYVHACIRAYSIRAYMYVCMCVFMHAYARAQTNLDFQCSNIH